MMPTLSGDDHDDEADGERIARAMDDARQDIAAHIVGAEQEGGIAARRPGRRRLEGVAELRVGRIGRDPGREQRHQHQQDEDDEADDGAAVHREIMPELGEGGGARALGHGGRQAWSVSVIIAPGCAD